MGTLFYGAARTPITIEDRTLAHLKVVITAKLRRGEAMVLSWDEPAEYGGGRGSIYIHPSSDLIYLFDGSRPPALDQQLLESLSTEAMNGSGITVAATMRGSNSRKLG